MTGTKKRQRWIIVLCSVCCLLLGAGAYASTAEAQEAGYSITGGYDDGSCIYIKGGESVTVTVSDGYQISPSAEGVFTDTITIPQEHYTGTVYLKDDGTGTVTETTITETVRWDADKPTGAITLNDSAGTFSSSLAQPDTSDWGQQMTCGGILHYVQADGTTSVEMMGAETTWLRETANGQNTWFGLQDPNGAVSDGVRFYIRQLSATEAPDAWNTYYSRIDEADRAAVEKDHITIILVGVEMLDGMPYNSLEKNVLLSMQFPDGWDAADLKAVHIRESGDERIALSVEEQQCPEGSGTFATLTMNQFLVYAVYDEMTQADKDAEAAEQNQNNTGESAPQPVVKYNAAAKKANQIVVKIDTKANGTAVVSEVKKTSKKKIAIAAYLTYAGYDYKVTVIDGKAFKNCKKATKITLPKTIEKIKKNGFYGAKKLKSAFKRAGFKGCFKRVK